MVERGGRGRGRGRGSLKETHVGPNPTRQRLHWFKKVVTMSHNQKNIGSVGIYLFFFFCIPFYLYWLGLGAFQFSWPTHLSILYSKLPWMI